MKMKEGGESRDAKKEEIQWDPEQQELMRKAEGLKSLLYSMSTDPKIIEAKEQLDSDIHLDIRSDPKKKQTLLALALVGTHIFGAELNERKFDINGEVAKIVNVLYKKYAAILKLVEAERAQRPKK